jgi:hypothetical protein
VLLRRGRRCFCVGVGAAIEVFDAAPDDVQKLIPAHDGGSEDAGHSVEGVGKKQLVIDFVTDEDAQ